MSSHREAPEISKDPVADSTDLYAFVSPDKPSTVTMIANYIPLEAPAGGPNFYEFGDDVLYEINVDNNGDGVADVTYQFQFSTVVGDPNTFLYNVGQIKSISSSNWNRKQFYSVTRVDSHGTNVLATNVPCPPCNVGPRSIPDYRLLARQATTTLKTGEMVFCGQRKDAFYVDLGSIFDLGDLRPFQNLQLIPMKAAAGVNPLATANVHSICIQVPISMLTADGTRPTSVDDPAATIGVWTSASRQKGSVSPGGGVVGSQAGPFVQVSRLGEPLINEVVIPMGQKDTWNTQAPSGDSAFVSFYEQPGLAALLPVLYPGVFPNLAKLGSTPRADLVAILLTGIPKGVVPGFQNYTGSTQADELRLNVAIPPANKPSVLGLLGGDPAGFPNGRRVFDDITTIELRAVACSIGVKVTETYP